MVFLATILPINGKYYPSVSRYKSEPYYFFVKYSVWHAANFSDDFMD